MVVRNDDGLGVLGRNEFLACSPQCQLLLWLGLWSRYLNNKGMNMNILSLQERAKELYPTSKKMQRQWVRHTFILTSRGIHLLQIGKFRYK